MIQKIKFNGKHKNYDYTFCICIGMQGKMITEDMINNILSQDEKYRFANLNPLKKREMFWGSYLAKKSLIELVGKIRIQLSDIVIDKGILHYPIFLGEFSNYCLSISHSNECIISAAYPQTLMMGIDIEKIHKNKIFTDLLLTENEKECRPKNVTESLYPIFIWTCKEALGKCIRVALSVNYEIYAIKSITQLNELYVSTFCNFHELIGYTFINEKYVYTFVLPKKVRIEGYDIGGIMDAL